MYKILLRAYLAENGQFSDDLDVGGSTAAIVAAAEAVGVSVTEFCYRCVGFTADDKFTAKDKFELRRGLSMHGMDGKANSSNYNDAEIVPQYFAPSGKQTPFNERYDNAIRTIANFMEHSTTAYVEHMQHYVPISQIIQAIKLSLTFNANQFRKALGDDVFNEEDEAIINLLFATVHDVIRNAETVPELKESYAIGGVLHIPEIPDKFLTKIEDLVLDHIARKTQIIIPKHFQKIYDLYPYYLITDILKDKKTPDFFLLLDLAHSYGCSIKELFDICGLRFIDQLYIFENINAFLFAAQDDRYFAFNLNDEYTDVGREQLI